VESALVRFQLSRRDQQRVWKAATETENFWEGLPEIEPGLVERLGRMSADRRWEVAFLTQRPATAGDTVQVQTQRWLRRYGFAMPSVFVVPHGARGKVAAALDLHLVVDDRPENCLDVSVESKARAILVWRGAPGLVSRSAERLGIGVVPSIAVCLETLEEFDDQSTASVPARFLDRLKKRLGIGL
jgi:hypothetical protein